MVDEAQQHALRQLPETAARNAQATAAELGWPDPVRAAELACGFADLVA